MASTQQYDVVLSCASEDHHYAEILVNELSQLNIRVFYDKNELAKLLGKNLYTYFSDLYQNRAHYCVMLLSQHYARKLWTKHEREAAQARAFLADVEYILPIRIDDTEIPGILSTIGYLDWNISGVESIAQVIREKLDDANSIRSTKPTAKTNLEQSMDINLTQLSTTKKRVLIVFANPSNTDPLRLGAEERVIREAIQLSTYRSAIDLTACHAATIHDLRRALLKGAFEIVHFSSHGSITGLVLENEQGSGYIVPQKAMADLFSAYNPPLQCVLLNACNSLALGELTSHFVPFTIAMDGPINDEAAIEFARGFYDAIGAGRDIIFAYEEGVRTVSLALPGRAFNAQIFRENLKPRNPTYLA